jgi:hypothetical protein
VCSIWLQDAMPACVACHQGRYADRVKRCEKLYAAGKSRCFQWFVVRPKEFDDSHDGLMLVSLLSFVRRGSGRGGRWTRPSRMICSSSRSSASTGAVEGCSVAMRQAVLRRCRSALVRSMCSECWFPGRANCFRSRRSCRPFGRALWSMTRILRCRSQRSAASWTMGGRTGVVSRPRRDGAIGLSSRSPGSGRTGSPQRTYPCRPRPMSHHHRRCTHRPPRPNPNERIVR